MAEAERTCPLPHPGPECPWAEVATLPRSRVIRDLVAAGANIEDAIGATVALRGRI